MTTPVALARIVKEVVNATPALIANDGLTGQVPEFIKVKFDSGTTSLFNSMSTLINIAYEALQEAYNQEVGTGSVDTPKEFQRLVVLRCLRLFCNTDTLKNTTSFIVRPFTCHDLSRVTSQETAPYAQNSGLLQLRHEISSDGGILFTWAVLTDGKVISRGEGQPIHKMIASLLRPLNLAASGSSLVQEAIAALANMDSSGTKYYIYLTNTKIAKHYMMFQEFLTTTSCMSKAASYYTMTGQGQHPMDAYSDSPDWRLMLLSEKSPEELLAMTEEAIANPDSAGSIMKYPFITRCMVLPVHLEESINRHKINTPYVFGKIYGNDKLVNYFFGNAHSSKIQAMNGNSLLTHSAKIAGGRIKREHSTQEENSDLWVLPYFDQQNLAKAWTDADGHWWKSTYIEHEMQEGTSEKASIVYRALYQEGIAESSYIYSPYMKSYNSHATRHPENILRSTLLGMETIDIVRSYYTSYTTNGTDLLVPSDMLVNGCMPYDLRKMITGELVSVHVLEASPERYIKLANDAGYCDLQNPAHCTLKQVMGY